MASRPRKSAIDYVIIALNPTLIVVMIASLVYFLTLCFYRGSFLGRMNYILMLFIVACVGIARIAIEEGRSRASMFAVALGAATLFSISRFVGGGLPLTVALLALIWYLADRITIDCTVIDDDQDASGEGLLQGGLFGNKSVAPAADVSLDGTTSMSGDDPVDRLLDETADSNSSAFEKSKRSKKPKKTHRPGIWVMYLAFGAIPLYGLGQVMLPASEAVQISALKSLGLYLASTLLLLVSTSFLGMRRYLRQRGVEMPSSITVNWLGFGAAIIVGLLLVCFALPLPGKMLTELDLGSDQETSLSASRFGWGNEGVNSDRTDVPGAENGEDPEEGQNQPSGEKGKGPKQSGGSKGKDGESGNSNDKDAQKKGSGGKSNGDKKRKGKTDEGDNGKESQKKNGEKNRSDRSQQRNSKDKDRDKQDASKNENRKDDNGNKQQGNQQSDDRENKDASQSDDASQNENSENPQASESEEGSPSDTPPPSSSKPFQMPSLPNLGFLLRALVFIVLVGVVLYYVVRYWDDLVQWFRDLMGLWNRETQEGTGAEAVAETKPLVSRKPFRSYRNPLADASIPLEEATVITFGALCAWAREAGVPRGDDQAPAEFARRFGKQYPEQKMTVATSCELYNLVVYGNGRVHPDQRNTLETIWRFMSQRPPQPERAQRDPVACDQQDAELIPAGTSASEPVSPPNEGSTRQRWKMEDV